jgi:hypothetical protein
MKKHALLLILCSITSPVWSTEAKLESIQIDTSASGVERGADTLMNACHSCHSLKYIRYRDLAVFGIDRKKIEAWRGEQPLDAPLTSLMSDDAAIQAFGGQGARGRGELCVFLSIGLLQHTRWDNQQSFFSRNENARCIGNQRHD